MAPNKLEAKGSPTGFARRMWRAPIGLYRSGLGFLFGHRFVMIEHRGRVSGEIRRTVLEVIVIEDNTIYVAAGWGESAQWLKNIRHDPRVVVHLGSRRFQTNAEMVPVDQARQIMDDYTENNPGFVMKMLGGFMLDKPGETPKEIGENIATNIPMVALPIPR
jgi:deazaflavin-dependent oxidoreductase (nitroreductase family)